MVGAVFINLTEAFDKVGQGVLLTKMYDYGIEEIEHELIRNYLFHREQFIHLEGNSSTKQLLLLGVPQGSIMGPLFFILLF